MDEDGLEFAALVSGLGPALARLDDVWDRRGPREADLQSAGVPSAGKVRLFFTHTRALRNSAIAQRKRKRKRRR